MHLYICFSIPWSSYTQTLGTCVHEKEPLENTVLQLRVSEERCWGSQKMVLWWDTRQGLNESHSMSMQTTSATESAAGSEIHVKTAVITGVTHLKPVLYCNSSKQWHNFVPSWKTDLVFKKDTFTRQDHKFCLPHIMQFSLVVGVWESKAPKTSSGGLRNFKKYYSALL